MCIRDSSRGAGKEITFRGYPVNDSDRYVAGILTGTHVTATAGNNHYVMVHNMLDGSNASWFNRLAADKTVAAHHAYVDTSALNTESPFKGYNIYLDEHPGGGNITGVESVATDDNGAAGFRAGTIVNVYTTSGAIVALGVEYGTTVDRLAPGVYIITDGMTTVKMAR
mgnify:FL=1